MLFLIQIAFGSLRITLVGSEGRNARHPSIPPAPLGVVNTVAEPVEQTSPGLAKTRPGLRLVREVA